MMLGMDQTRTVTSLQPQMVMFRTGIRSVFKLTKTEVKHGRCLTLPGVNCPKVLTSEKNDVMTDREICNTLIDFHQFLFFSLLFS